MNNGVGSDFLDELDRFGVLHRTGITGPDHAILSQKQGQPESKHSPFFANLRPYLQSSERSRRVAKRLIDILEGAGVDLSLIQGVVSSSNSAIQLGRTFGDLLGVDDVFTDKNKQGVQEWNGGFWVGSKLLFHLEELITSMRTGHNVRDEMTKKTKARMFELKGRHLVGTLVFRPEVLPVPSRPNLYPLDFEGISYIVATVAAIQVPAYWASQCPLCPGSEAIPGRKLIPEISI